MLQKIVILMVVTISLFSNNFMLKNEDIIVKKAEVKLNAIINELYEKTGSSIYIVAIKTLPEGKNIVEYEKDISKNLKSPYVLLVFAELNKKIDMLISKDLQKIIDEDEIFDDYILPILTDRSSKISDKKKYNASIFNGVAQMADEIAKYNNIKLENSIGNESKDFFDNLMFLIKTLLILTVGAFIYVYLKRKR